MKSELEQFSQAGLPFLKMHGCGNDYVFIDGFTNSIPSRLDELAVPMSDRRRGIGADGLIVMLPVGDDSADVELRIWNADGSAAEMCGNGVRCVALWMHGQNRVDQVCRIQVAGKIVTATLTEISRDFRFAQVSVDMGSPQLNDAPDNHHLSLRLPGSEETPEINYTPVSMGNPHAVVFDRPLTDRNVRQLGRIMQQHSAFPEGVNVEWVDVVSSTEITVRVLERGSGETQACGSGACAAVVAAVVRGLCERDVDITVNMPGGQMLVRWSASANVILTGPAELSFQGQWWSTKCQPAM